MLRDVHCYLKRCILCLHLSSSWGPGGNMQASYRSEKLGTAREFDWSRKMETYLESVGIVGNCTLLSRKYASS